ncbi:MAG: carbohydrate binding family 9 domain-containing protein [Bacteroidales bacterium]|nr:carbohydrate binding family 9 domain-containing protein [Bacteroidales bacterium]
MKNIVFGILIIGLSVLSFKVNALNNDKRTLEVVKVSESPKIDGILDESVWLNAAVAKDFYQYAPYNGVKPSLPTTVKIIYDDHAIYFAAILTDNQPDSILKDLSTRDSFDGANADLFAVGINTFNDGINAVNFMVSAAGIQSDAKITGEEGDANWDAVWESAVKITENGWIVELKIPYSALRFSKEDNQTWGIHFFRHIRRYREWSTWNFVDINVRGFINQMGEMSGIKDIEPPLRLSVTPYVSAYLENDAAGNTWANDFNAGMDLKWGMNQSFTLDMILIPDFGQVQSDDEVLNLSPFEVRYDEKRQYFTEGTELFNKGKIFYSRRIGGSPKGPEDVYDHLKINEEVTRYPAETKLINATKISGRTSDGLGIGFLNAMTGAVDAEIKDTITGNKRFYQTQGFTNYNMLVLDQTLKNNSYVSFVNTNVLHAEENYTANVTGGEFKLMNKENSYQIFGRGGVSQIYTDTTDIGHTYEIQLAKIKGNFLFELTHLIESDTYDPNDMGYIQQNNESTWDLELSYNKNEPFWKVLNWHNEISFRQTSLYKPRKYSDFEVNFRSNTTFAKRYLHLGFFAETKPFNRYDYFEPRVDGWKYNRHKMAYSTLWLSTDYRKKLALSVRAGGWKAFGYNQYGYNYSLEPRIRFSDKWLLIYNLNMHTAFNTYGYIEDYTDAIGNTIINFGKRDQQTLTNTLNTNYIFNNKSSLSLRVRHYWSRVEYTDFYRLEENGELSNSIGYDTYGEDQNYNYNAFTIDMKYLWRFAPGSEMAIVWKNAIYSSETNIVNDFFDNLNSTFESSQINSISLKFLYYLDYQYLVKK